MTVDGMDDEFMHTYWAHPERFFVIWDGKLELKAVPKGEGYRNEDLAECLEELCARIGKSS